MATNEENAFDIVHQCLIEAGVGKTNISDVWLANRIVACLAEVELIPEDDEPVTLLDAVMSYHELPFRDASSKILNGYFSVDGETVHEPRRILRSGQVIQSTEGLGSLII